MNKQQEPLAARVVLGVAAHPDDLDFAAGGTIAKLTANGTQVFYLILTNGSRGTADAARNADELIQKRQQEQQAAAQFLGVEAVFFCDYQDGELVNSSDVRRDIVRHIRKIKPDMVITLDPSMIYAAEMGFVNHPDHRAAGQATLDATYPLARDRWSFPELEEEGLQPHNTATLLLANFTEHNYCVDITGTLDKKIHALMKHVSQVGPLEQSRPMLEKMAVSAGRSIGCDKAEPFIRIDITA